MLAAALAVVATALFAWWVGVVTLAVLGTLLLGLRWFLRRPIGPEEVVIADWGAQDVVAKVESVSGPEHRRMAKIWVSSEPHPFAVDVPYGTLRRRTAKERFRMWLLG